MAKETTIIFVYDTELLKREEDDPNSAILYFYPTWVSDQQKTALCGQLMGTVMCLQSILAMPKTVSLQTGKFFFVENGRYILVVGSDRNISDWVLEDRANLIYSLVKFFHKDFVALAQLFDTENLNAKLYHIFDTYLKLMFLGGCIFSHIPLLDLSKTEKVLMNIKTFLDNCKCIPNILGGLLLYHNKIVHTQLSTETSKLIAFSDPFRIKNPAELSDVNFVPQGVKLFYVYIPNEEFQTLFESCIQDEDSGDLSLNETNNNKKDLPEAHTSSSSLLKRDDTSLLFTSVPEDTTFSPQKEPYKLPQENKKNKRSRPNSLNLKSCSLDSSGDLHMDLRKTPATPYWSQSSGVSTPMTEIKPFVDPSDSHKSKYEYWKMSMDFHQMNLTQDSAAFMNSSITSSENGKYCQTINISYPLEAHRRQLEKAERMLKFVHDTLAKTSLFRTSSFRNLSPRNSIQSSSNQYSIYQNCEHSKRSIKFKRWRSVHDPLFPWYRGEDTVVSQYYVENVLDKNFGTQKFEKGGYTSRQLVKECKKTLTLPIKPHNASEAQKSPGSYCTPLMNKLSTSNVSEVPQSSEEIHSLHFIAKKTETCSELQKCALFMYGEGDMVFAVLLIQEYIENKKCIEMLHHKCSKELPELQKQIMSSLEYSKTTVTPDSSPYSVLAVDPDWGTIKRNGPWDRPDLNDLTRLHDDFNKYEDVTDIYLRKPESVLFGHKDGSTEVFYQEAAPSSSGLLSPNDALGTVTETAKKRLEKDHNISIK